MSELTPEQIRILDAAAKGEAGNAPRPLRSLYGYGERPQEIYTPECVRDALRQLWPEGIELDPCSGPESVLGARRTYYVPPTVLPPNKPGGKPKIIYRPEDGQDGLTLPWLPRSYANPPFNSLRVWLEAWARAPLEVCMLAPTRPHRKWFRKAMKQAHAEGGIVHLDPLRFRGHKFSFPAPLCILYRGERVDLLEEAFAALGEMV